MDPHHASPPPRPFSRPRLWGPVALYCALIFALSSVSAVPALPEGISDKLAHTLLYSGLGFLVARALAGGLDRPPTLQTALVVVAFAAVYGFSDEVHQLFVPRRQFDVRDMMADVTGAAVGVAALWLWGILRGTRDVI